MITAQDFLQQAQSTMEERGKTYDNADEERSMGKTIKAFNSITGHTLTAKDGWLLMLILKQVRQWSAHEYHEDSALDAVAYAALLAEEMANEK